jgi:hypothetical protein
MVVNEYICIMRLDPFITDLLYDHDCVILPEFGGLVANYRSARLNVISHVIQPPAKSIGFNPSLKYNDGLLANYISAVLGVSYKEASSELAQTISKYQQLLSTEGRFSIDRIGVFYKDRMGQTQFIPEEQENFLTSSHGLKPIQLKPVSAMETDSNDSDSIIPINREQSMRRWKVAAAILLPALLAGSWMLGSRASEHGEMGFSSLNPFGEARKNSAYAPVQDSWDFPMNFATTDYSYLLNDSVQKCIDFVNGVADQDGIAFRQAPTANQPSEVAEPAKTESVATTVKQPVKSKVDEPKKTTSNAAYTLIGGAFQVKENAQRLIDQLRAEGFDAELAGMKENLYLVSYGNFANRADAEAIQASVKAKGAKAWIRTNQ